MPQMQAEVKQWEQKYKALMSLDDLRKKVDKLKQEMAWSQVYEFEKVITFLIYHCDVSVNDFYEVF